MKYVLKLSLGLGLLAAVATGPAWGYTSNWWNTASGDYTNTANWSGGAPSSTDGVFFTNQATYTVQFSTSVTNGPVFIYDSSPTFDLNGYIWKNTESGYGCIINTNTTASRTVTFSSSQAPQVTSGNLAMLGTAAWETDLIGPLSGGASATTDIVVDDSLGYGAQLYIGGGYTGTRNVRFLVSGPGSELQVGFPNGFGLGGDVLITNGAVLRASVYTSTPMGLGGWAYGASTTRVINASMYTTGVALGPPYGSATLILQNSTWNDSGPITVGGDRYYDANPYRGDILMTNSTMVGQRIQIGGAYGNPPAPGRVQVIDSSATFSNSVLVTAVSNTQVRSTLVLNNGTINLGGGSTAGVLTNFGVMRAAGTIRGLGSSPAQMYVGMQGGTGSVFEIGASIGTLNLINVDLTVDVGSRTDWEFSDTGLDQILIAGGSASLSGSNVFSLASGSAPLGPYKWGLGAYDFVVGDSVTWNSQYDNLTNILANAGLVQGLHYNYGIFNLDGGLQALRLEFVPEPSTILLLVGGGLLLWRFRRRRG